jgi:hypothetical protein
LKKNALFLAVVLTVLFSCSAHKSPAAIDLAVNTDGCNRVAGFEIFDVTGSKIMSVNVTYDAAGNLARRDVYNGNGTFAAHMEHNISNTRWDTFDSLGNNVEWAEQTFTEAMLTGQVRYTPGPSVYNSIASNLVNGVYDTTYFYRDTGAISSDYGKYFYLNDRLEKYEIRSVIGDVLMKYFVFDYSQDSVITANLYEGTGVLTQHKMVFRTECMPSNVTFDTFFVMISNM